MTPPEPDQPAPHWPRPRRNPATGAPKLDKADRLSDEELAVAREALRTRYGPAARR